MTPPDTGDPSVKPFLEHLEDLRRTVLHSLAALVLGMLAAWPFAPRIFGILKAPLARAVTDPDRFLQPLSVTGGFSVALTTIFWSGLLLSSPAILFFVCRFVFPGLTPRERRAIARASGLALVLFLLGVSIGYGLTIQVALGVMFRVNGWMLGGQPEFVKVTDYVGFVLKLLLGFGLVFELPAVILVLGGLGLVSSAQLRASRKYVIVGALVLAMLLTPPDPFTQLIMAGPLIVLYEICIWVLWAKERREHAPGAQP